jgi:hypothetical protein
LDKYQHRAKDILKFAIDYNRRIAAETVGNDCYISNELGGIKSFRDNDYYNLIIFVDVDVKDSEIKDLVNQLPKFKNYF